MTRLSIQKELYDLWFKHYTRAGDAERVELVQTFIDDNLNGINPAEITAKHPAHYKRASSARYRQYEVSEILGDFIIRGEEAASGMTASPQTEINREYRRNENEEAVDFSDSFDDEEQAEIGSTSLRTEFDIYKQRRELYPDFTEEVKPELTAEEFAGMIERIKSDAKRYAGIYSEKYRKDYNATLKRIRGLDVKRVAICEECGEVYYKHDMRRKVCDLRPSCEVNSKRRRESERYYEEKSKKVKVRADVLHYVIEGSKTKPVLWAYGNKI